MQEWSHVCKSVGRPLLIPAGELCDRCGMEPPELSPWEALAKTTEAEVKAALDDVES